MQNGRILGSFIIARSTDNYRKLRFWWPKSSLVSIKLLYHLMSWNNVYYDGFMGEITGVFYTKMISEKSMLQLSSVKTHHWIFES